MGVKTPLTSSADRCSLIEFFQRMISLARLKFWRKKFVSAEGLSRLASALKNAAEPSGLASASVFSFGLLSLLSFKPLLYIQYIVVCCRLYTANTAIESYDLNDERRCRCFEYYINYIH